MSRALGRYELVRPLARGGMAEVFLARRRAAGVEKLLVVKRIRPERAGDVRFHELFMREAKLSMSLTHQNIVQTFDFGRAGDQVFLAMERVEGRDLGSSFVRDKQPLSSLLGAFIAAECCQALSYAHNRHQDGALLGVVHRDVTLRNVLVSWSGEVKLSDFGIAALAGEDTSKLVGTPAYMAPEQARGEAIDVRADLYGVGMILRELLTGERARPGDDREALISAARQGSLAPWRGEIEEALVAIVDRATAAKPADRYPDAAEMHADLDAFIVGQRANQRGDSPARQLAAWIASVWGDERDDPASDAAVEGGDEMMSFLDDAGAIGTGTERSLAATAADEPLPRIVEAKAARALDADAREPTRTDARDGATRDNASDAGDARAKASRVDAATRDTTARDTEAQSPRRRIAWIAVALVAATAIVVAIVASRHTSSPTGSGAVSAQTSDATLAIDSVAVASDALGSAVATGVDAVRPGSDGSQGSTRQGSAGAQGSNPRQDSATQGSNPRQGSGSATRVGSGGAIRAGSGSGAIRAGSGSVGSGSAASGSGAGSAIIALRKVHINATPWAFFTVDGGPRHQTPKLLELPPGPHQIYFVNDVLKVERTITLVVPADRDMSHVEPLR